MDEAYLLQVASIIFFSAWKTYIGPAIAAASNFAYWEMLLFNMGAALSSTIATIFMTDLWMNQRQKKQAKGFDRRLRKALRIWKRQGKHTTLFLSPILLGVPSYALLARRLKQSRRVIMLELSFMTFVWCSLIYWASLEGILMINHFNQ